MHLFRNKDRKNIFCKYKKEKKIPHLYYNKVWGSNQYLQDFFFFFEKSNSIYSKSHNNIYVNKLLEEHRCYKWQVDKSHTN